MSETIWGLDAARVNAFTDAYVKSKDLALQALWAKRLASNVDGGSLITEAEALAKGGDSLVLGEVDAWGECPLIFMITKKNAGYEWFPNMMQAVPGSPEGYGDPNVRPPGALRVSTDPNDFKPFTPPVVTPPAHHSVIGNSFGGFQIDGHEVFSAAAQDHFPEGFPVVGQDGSTYKYHLMGNPAADPLERTGVWLKQ